MGKMSLWLRVNQYYLRVNQYYGVFSFFYNLCAKDEIDLSQEFRVLLAMLYVEKCFVLFLNYMERITASVGDVPKYDLNAFEKVARRFIGMGDPMRVSAVSMIARHAAAEVEDNYSPLSQWVLEVPEKIFSHMPNSFKKAAVFIQHELTMSTNEYVARALKQGRVAKNIHMHLDALTNEEAVLLIRALKNGHVPVGLTISYDKNGIDPLLDQQIQELIKENDIRHAALACVTLQQGKRDPNSLCSVLPQEMLTDIYENVCPSFVNNKERKQFVVNVSANRSGLFSHRAVNPGTCEDKLKDLGNAHSRSFERKMLSG